MDIECNIDITILFENIHYTVNKIMGTYIILYRFCLQNGQWCVVKNKR